jgi:hypothetical protein
MSKNKDRKARRELEQASEHLSGPERLDVQAAASAAQYRKHPVTRVAAQVAELSDQPPLFALCSAVLAAGLVTGNARLRLCGERMLVAFLLATAFKQGGKTVFARTRPKAVLKKGKYRRKVFGPTDGDWNAFPSGHTAGAVAVARAAARTYPDLAAAFYGAAAFAGVTQVFKGNHYPSDVAAGTVVGCLAEAISEVGVSAANAKLSALAA